VGDSYGQPSDAASANAATGTSVIANIFDKNKTPGSVSRCTLAHGCKTNLRSKNMDEVAGRGPGKKRRLLGFGDQRQGRGNLDLFQGVLGVG
jgi:hypothetical protein